MLGLAPDYDHLTVIQKVEVFEHALESTSGEDLHRVMWLKSRSSEVGRPECEVVETVVSFGSGCMQHTGFSSPNRRTNLCSMSGLTGAVIVASGPCTSEGSWQRTHRGFMRWGSDVILQGHAIRVDNGL